MSVANPLFSNTKFNTRQHLQHNTNLKNFHLTYALSISPVTKGKRNEDICQLPLNMVKIS